MINENEDPRFFKDWRENVKFVNDNLKLDEQLITASFICIQKIRRLGLKKNFKHRRSNEIFNKSCENNRQLWRY